MRIDLSKTTIVRGIVAVGFAGAVTMGTVGVADGATDSAQYCRNQAYEPSTGKVLQRVYDECMAKEATPLPGTDSTQQTQSTDGVIPQSEAQPGTQAYHDACIGPSDVNPNWQPQAWCSSGQQTQSVPTYVPAGGQAPANYDATNDRSADTLVLR
ncbi:MAG: hypothetical protein J2P17_35110 [Mycobacterium sp.]|nr:hypothetical protein [Mycobacterium sp.]